MRRMLACVLALAGCRQILGIDELPDAQLSGDAVALDSSGPDAPNTATLSLAVATQPLAQKSSTSVAFTIARGAGENAPLTVTVGGLPANVSAPDVAIAAGASSGTLVITADLAAALLSTGTLSVALKDGAQTLDTRALAFTIVGPHGGLDTTFGIGGARSVPIADSNATSGAAAALVVYPPTAGANADKILVATSLTTTGATHAYAVVRFTAAGQLDTTFNGGKGYTVVTSTAGTTLAPAALALDSQLRIVVTTHLDCVVVIQRLLATGAIDTSFNAYQGHANPDNSCGAALSVATLAGDKSVSLSLTNVSADQSIRPALVQLADNGLPDPSGFGASNFVVPNPEAPTKRSLPPDRLLVDKQGRYLIAGAKCDGGYNTATDPLANCESVVGRLLANGTWDKAFHTTGFSAVTFGATTSASVEQFTALALDPAGNVVAVGQNENQTSATLARFNGDNGALDPSFAGVGSLTTTFGATGPIFVDDVVVDAAGIVVVGYANGGMAVARYTASGVLDASYGVTRVSTAVGVPRGAALQSNGRLVVAGAVAHAGGGTDVNVWRFWP